jgi:uncharacterized tellurite resistance protein B-like protein
MDEKFSQEEQIAIASVLSNLVYADFKRRSGEEDCLKNCFDELGLELDGFEAIPRNELPTKAYATLKVMSEEKKRAFSLMMTQISRSDSHFGPREQKYVKEILEYCEIPFVHK